MRVDGLTRGSRRRSNPLRPTGGAFFLDRIGQGDEVPLLITQFCLARKKSINRMLAGGRYKCPALCSTVIALLRECSMKPLFDEYQRWNFQLELQPAQRAWERLGLLVRLSQRVDGPDRLEVLQEVSNSVLPLLVLLVLVQEVLVQHRVVHGLDILPNHIAQQVSGG